MAEPKKATTTTAATPAPGMVQEQPVDSRASDVPPGTVEAPPEPTTVPADDPFAAPEGLGTMTLQEMRATAAKDEDFANHPAVAAILDPAPGPGPGQVVPAVHVLPAHLQYGTDSLNRPLYEPRATTDTEERERLAKERERIDGRLAELDKARGDREATAAAEDRERGTLTPEPPPTVKEE